MFKKVRKFDIILAVAVLAAGALFMFLFQFAKKDGSYVVVRQGKKLVGEYPLSVDGTYEITTFYGRNVLVIKDNEAYMAESDCPDHICERMGHIKNTGETIICLPNEVFITITDRKGGE